MSKYGYVGKESDAPQQAFKANAGVLNPNDIIDLSNNNKLTQFGQLELIETQTHSSDVADIDFTSIQESTYNVHFMTISNLKAGAASQSTGIQLYENGTLETANVYDYANDYVNLSGGGSEIRSTGYKHIRLFNTSSQAINGINAYVYFYNLGDSSKYSFTTMQHFMEANSGTMYGFFGSGLLPQTSQVTGIRIDSGGSNNYTDFDISLYGIRFA
tara:strand:+ start:97 stop:741 length:645 start_codon:yes stop_codon:yes gene_type:complete